MQYKCIQKKREKMKILYFYCGEGLGHVTPTIAAGRALEKEHEVVYASYGYAREFGIKAGLNVKNVPSEIRLVGNEGRISVSKSIIETIKKTNPAALLKYRTIIKEEKPDLVISDSFMVPIIYAKHKKIPTWIILNQTALDKFFTMHANPAVRALGKLLKRFNFSVLKKADKILVRDFAPPYTVCSQSLIFPKNAEKKIHYLGPLARKQGYEIKVKKEKQRIYSAIGGFGYRSVLLNRIVEVSKLLPNYHFDLVAGPNAIIKAHGKNVTTYGNINDPLPLIKKASVAIVGAGHSTMMDATVLGTPILSAPDIAHFEQESNANGIEKLGLGYRISYETSATKLVSLIKELENSKTVKKKLNFMQKLAKKQDGRKEIARLARELERKSKK